MSRFFLAINNNRVIYCVSFLTLFFWLLSCKSTQAGKNLSKNNQNDFNYIFNGKTLDGWEGDAKYWRVENGVLVGEVTPETILKNNSFIIYKLEKPENFELKLEYRISDFGNSGINYRSEILDANPYARRG